MERSLLPLVFANWFPTTIHLAVPSIAVMSKSARLIDVVIPVVIGATLAIPMILSTKFVVGAQERIRFKRNVFLYCFLIGIPVLRRYVGFTEFFKVHPIFIPHTNIPDIQRMIVMYLTVILVNIYVWRISSYLKYTKLKATIAPMTKPPEASVKS